MSKKKDAYKWTPIIIRVSSGEKNIPSPFDKNGIIESLFVLVQKDTKMGWGRIWCSATLRGVHLSRMQIPDNLPRVFLEEEDTLKIPEIKIESIN